MPKPILSTHNSIVISSAMPGATELFLPSLGGTRKYFVVGLITCNRCTFPLLFNSRNFCRCTFPSLYPPKCMTDGSAMTASFPPTLEYVLFKSRGCFCSLWTPCKKLASTRRDMASQLSAVRRLTQRPCASSLCRPRWDGGEIFRMCPVCLGCSLGAVLPLVLILLVGAGVPLERRGWGRPTTRDLRSRSLRSCASSHGAGAERICPEGFALRRRFMKPISSPSLLLPPCPALLSVPRNIGSSTTRRIASSILPAISPLSSCLVG